MRCGCELGDEPTLRTTDYRGNPARAHVVCPRSAIDAVVVAANRAGQHEANAKSQRERWARRRAKIGP